MRLLVLGGTMFLGRAVARLAAAAGHDVTCAARGVSGEPVPGVRFVRADRDDPAGLSALDGERFDAVVDVTRRPSHARHAVAALADRVGHWSYVSTCSVYADNSTPGQRAATAEIVAPAPVEVDNPVGEHAEYYGPCKVSCEQAVLDTIGAARSFVCRAGLIVGPEDPSDRFPYWVARLDRGGEVLAPGAPDEVVQLVDVEDLAQWLLYAAETGLTGIFDGMGAPLPRAGFLAEVAAGVGRPDPDLTWVEQDFLVERDVREWSGERALPLWLPLPEYAGFLSRDVTASLAAGLRTRPIAETAARTLEWLRTHPDDVRRGGLEPADEAKVLREWSTRIA
ncbi:NAD-dependent epimerase/dehydratase family protein [Micromonospora sp. NBC_01796]|uniref:NAD-dependent epimerase/dehydratase family protein n=1 Tax=Micromonospora sp. NBC_01796 TaxID=2975987 RepID=UPI002DDAED26|nr:NAD-dependent epimerase/dehydratase family protein [Micromonospora sp. NBC_01796]WSA82689.1 NAD-dependent epimerase/dehydratase family protein [Micromonospora sp. NBC_01796]